MNRNYTAQQSALLIVLTSVMFSGCVSQKEGPFETQTVPSARVVPAPSPEPSPDPVPTPEKSDAEFDNPPDHAGTASWYGPGLYGETMANGETYDPTRMIAAHRTLPLGTRVRITRPDTGRSVEAVIADRGPFVDGRVIDLSEKAATELDIMEDGLAEVEIEILE